MRNLILLFALIALPAAAQEKKDIQLLQIGSFHGEEVSSESGEKWLALRMKDSGCTLEEVEMVEPSYDPLMDFNREDPKDQSTKTGKAVSIKDAESAGIVVLMRGKRLKPGKVEVAFPPETPSEIRKPGNFAPLAFIPLTLGKRSYGLKLNIAWASKYQEENVCELQLEQGKAQQTIARQYPPDSEWKEDRAVEALACLAGDGFPELVWAGDLDRDGKLDLLLSPNYHYNVSGLSPFLSSQAGEGELVKRVAEFTAAGC